MITIIFIYFCIIISIVCILCFCIEIYKYFKQKKLIKNFNKNGNTNDLMKINISNSDKISEIQLKNSILRMKTCQKEKKN